MVKANGEGLKNTGFLFYFVIGEIIKMKKGIMDEVKYGTVLFCIIYSVATLISSIFQLIQGQSSETNIHLLNRGAVVLIGVITFMLFFRL
jgi:surface polysaccharide O-acyltransferase-like enzyme